MKKVFGILFLLAVIAIFSMGGAECGKKKSGDTIVRSSAPAPTPPSAWTTKAPMPTARSAFAIGVVNDKIYAIGGTDGTSYLAIVEEYNPASNTWTTKASMTIPKAGIACAVFNNKIYVVGGEDADYYYAAVLIYTPASNTWTSGSAMTARSTVAAGMVNNKIFVMGGYTTSSGYPTSDLNECYEPGSDSWLQYQVMPTALFGGSIEVINNMIYYIGGVNVDETYQAYFSRYNYLFNPNNNQFLSKQFMLTYRAGLRTGVVNNKIYAIGGLDTAVNYLSINEEYDPALDP